MSDKIARNPELADLDRSSNPYQAFGRLADRISEALLVAAEGFTSMEAQAKDLDTDSLHSEMAKLLPELRISAVKATALAQSLLTVTAVAKLISNVGREEETR